MLDDNLALERQCVVGDFANIFVSNKLIDAHILGTAYAKGYSAPLYLYPDNNGQQTLDGKPERKPNLDAEIVQEIADGLGLRFTPEKEPVTASEKNEENGARQSPNEKANNAQGDRRVAGAPRDASNEGRAAFAPIDLLDYIYAVLHSPTYREKYKEFLKIDFPRVPYPTDAETFWQLVELGGELRQIHLLEHPVVDEFITTYPEPGPNKITKRLTKTDPGFMLYEEEGVASGNSGRQSERSPDTDRDEVEDKAAPSATHTGDDHRYPGERLGQNTNQQRAVFRQRPRKGLELLYRRLPAG
ncbi:MAG: type ISP restriction/modification enzyme [Balneolaceae bacterium]|nr:type ISP restriction/modification enzyme [Balneolaceae bacterium]